MRWEVNDWGSGFVVNVTVTNRGPALNGWTLSWTFGGTQRVTNAWQARITQSGAAVTAVNETYNANLATNGTVSFGFNGTWTTSNPVPTAFTLNGTACGDGTSTNVAPTVSVTSPAAGASYTAPASVSITANAADSDGTGRIARK